jgi:hypothetical protein
MTDTLEVETQDAVEPLAAPGTIAGAVTGVGQITFTVTGGSGQPLGWRFGDSTTGWGKSPMVKTYKGAGAWRVVGVDGPTGQQFVLTVNLTAAGAAVGVPTITSLSSATVKIGPPTGLGLHIYGTGFTPWSVARVNGVLQPTWTTYISATELLVNIPAGTFPSALASVPVTVLDSSVGGGESAAVNFAVA